MTVHLDEVIVSTTGSSVQIHLLELVAELAYTATYETLTAEYGDISEEEKGIRFATECLYTADNGDIYYNEVAQDVFADFQEYYERVLVDLFRIEGV